MRDYAELVKALRFAWEQPCYDCVFGEKCNWGDFCFFKRAADAIEELSRNLKDCRNELCLRCGDYIQRHMGACNGCRWLPEPPKGVE